MSSLTRTKGRRIGSIENRNKYVSGQRLLNDEFRMYLRIYHAIYVLKGIELELVKVTDHIWKISCEIIER